MQSPSRIERYALRPRSADLLGEIDGIFFAASATKSFANPGEREAFRVRWLGRYLERYPEWAYLALDDTQHVQGYLVGSLDDPARTPLFSDITYFRDLSHLTASFPAHLHVNLAPEWRGQGLGSRLVAAFVEDARKAGARGVHVVTARGMDNVAFYLKNGFREEGSLLLNGRELLFLAKALDAA